MAGHNRVATADLRELAEALGLGCVRTVRQSGNLVFKSAARNAGSLEALLERAIAHRFGVKTCAMVRTAVEWKKIVARNPFRAEAKNDPGRFAVMFLKDRPARKNVAALKNRVTGREYFEVRGRELYAVYPDGFGKTKLTMTLIDRMLATRSTGRSWSTVLKLADL